MSLQSAADNAAANSGPSRALIAPFETATPLTPNNTVDELAFDGMRRSGYSPAPLCSDAVFLRRVYLDVIGTLPTPDETLEFLADTSSSKRDALIDRLLARDEYADYWAMRWADTLRIKSEFSINLWPMAAQAYHRWVRDTLQNNWPYDRFARTLLTASGSNFRNPEVNFYRAVESKTPPVIAAAVALTFMGARADKWPKARLDQMAVFFSMVGYKYTLEWKEEIVDYDPAKAAAWASAGNVIHATFPDGATTSLTPARDPREVFADWLITPRNPWFTTCEANRIWYWLTGRGIVDEPDDIRPDNPPVNQPLLHYLREALVAYDYDVQSMFRLILSSKTYQLSAIPARPGKNGEAVFANASVSRLGAEVLIDAIDQITGSHESYSNQTPEPYTFIPDAQRTVQLADGSITSSFLEMFGRPARDSGLDSERNNKMNTRQCLHLLNSTHIQDKLTRSAALQAIAASRMAVPDKIDALTVLVLCRHATDQEKSAAGAYFAAAGAPQSAAVLDIAWALINTPEFLYRH